MSAEKRFDLTEVANKIEKFVKDRDWNKFHSPKNLSMGIAAESAELMELFLWCGSEESYEILEKLRKNAEHEIADIAFLVLRFCNEFNIDLKKVMEEKLTINEAKYPVEKVKGISDAKFFMKPS